MLAMEYTWAKYSADGLLRPIEDWISEDLQADFIPVFINPDEKDAVPDLASVRGTFHNTAILEEAGIDGLPETFDELDDALEAHPRLEPRRHAARIRLDARRHRSLVLVLSLRRGRRVDR